MLKLSKGYSAEKVLHRNVQEWLCVCVRLCVCWRGQHAEWTEGWVPQTNTYRPTVNQWLWPLFINASMNNGKGLKDEHKHMWHWSIERVCRVLTFWWDSVFMRASRQTAMMRVQTGHMTCAITTRRWTPTLFFPWPWGIWTHTQTHK